MQYRTLEYIRPKPDHDRIIIYCERDGCRKYLPVCQKTCVKKCDAYYDLDFELRREAGLTDTQLLIGVAACMLICALCGAFAAYHL